MGLYCFPSPREGVLPLLLINTVVSVALLKNLVRSLFLLMGARGNSSNSEEDSSIENLESSRARRVSITRYGSLCKNRCNIARTKEGSSGCCSCSGSGNGNGPIWPTTLMECCVCLSGFEADQEVSELSCKHFFHKGCLEKWFDNQHSTCPLCRSVL